ncbi:MAG: HAD-IA family hydrolase [Victivallales bacterium]|nr:HAD-IA family hydrolase [Victivallales bacterium]
MKYHGIIFDMDGTITVPIMDFNRLRQTLGIPAGQDIVRTLKLRPEQEQRQAWRTIENYENEQAEQNALQPGVRETLRCFAEHNIKLALLTRNTSRNVTRLRERFGLSFDLCLSRDFEFIKPSPKPIRHILERWGITPQHCLVVGDYLHDLECGQAAGCPTCFFHNDGKDSYAAHADYTVTNYRELKELVLA